MFALLVLLPASVSVLTTSPASGATFSPTAFVCLDDSSTVDAHVYTPGDAGECDGDTTPGASSGVTIEYRVPEPDAMADTMVFFAPPGWGIPADAGIADGTLVGEANLMTGLGFLGNVCADPIPIEFVLREATTDQSQQVSFANQFAPSGPATRGVIEYPDYLARTWVAQTTNPASTLQPIARYYGQLISGFIELSLNIAVFQPGTTYRGFELSPQLGYPIVVTAQRTGQFDQFFEPQQISDDCSPQTISVAVSNGVWTNPGSAGFHGFAMFAAGQRDADGDGYENGLDSCPFLANSGWDPRQVQVGDFDNDGLPDECDPLPDEIGNPGIGGVRDHDGDSYYNMLDNCPLVQNSLGVPLSAFSFGPDNQADDDFDDIGNACDPFPLLPNGDRSLACAVNPVQVGTGGPPALDPTELVPCSAAATTIVCEGGCEDNDVDGVIDAFDNCPVIANPGQEDSENDGIGDVCEPVGGVVEVLMGREATGDPGVHAALAAGIAGIALVAASRRAVKRRSR
ncbi:MAG: thrombospondin type 3 repeat-containing protein [Dehalococcoidia bacterium]